MDQHDMMEMMMNKNNSLKPYPFEKLMQNTAAFMQQEAVDGLNLNVMFPLGNNFQLGGQWTLSNSKGAHFEITSSVNNASGDPYQSHDDVHSAIYRFSTDGTGMVMGAFNLPWKMQL